MQTMVFAGLNLRPVPSSVLSPEGGSRLYDDSYVMIARPICFKLFWHCERRAASRACCTAGSKSDIRIAIIAITTRSSIKVNPTRLLKLPHNDFIGFSSSWKMIQDLYNF